MIQNFHICKKIKMYFNAKEKIKPFPKHPYGRINMSLDYFGDED